MAKKTEPNLDDAEKLFEQIRVNAFQSLRRKEHETTNLFLDERVYKPGELIGPKAQDIHAKEPSVLVFADDVPTANFAHPCRYLLFDPETSKLLDEIPARFPPFATSWPRTLKAFHEPVRVDAAPIRMHVRPPLQPPILPPKGQRYAILFAGATQERHLNDMEFLYRVLIERYAFPAGNIQVLMRAGTLEVVEGVPKAWPGDSTPYRIKFTGKGTRADLEAAIDSLKPVLTADDLLLIHTNGHGDWKNQPGTANLSTHPDCVAYFATDFAAKLAQLPNFAKLVVMTEQCHGGGFNAPILANSPATDTSVASAAYEGKLSFFSDINWDPFARGWVAAHARHDADGTFLWPSPDTDGDGKIEASEAFDFADGAADSRDTPNFSPKPPDTGGSAVLGREYLGTVWWNSTLRECLLPYFQKLPDDAYARLLNGLLPELEKLTTALDESLEALRGEYAPKIQALVKGAFEP